MHTIDWPTRIAEESHLAQDYEKQLDESGFFVMPGPIAPDQCKQLSDAYDQAVATADPVDVHTGKSKTSTRVDDFVNRGAEFDPIYIYPPLLAACCQIIGGPFKLSGMRARTLHPGASMEKLHVDVEHQANGWPLVGCILMIDAFDSENGATRFVPGSHLLRDKQYPQNNEVLAGGPAGSIIIFNASVWHGHGANRSAKPRRSIQAHFVPRAAQASSDDHSGRMRAETLERISDLAKYVLNV